MSLIDKLNSLFSFDFLSIDNHMIQINIQTLQWIVWNDDVNDDKYFMLNCDA